MYSFVSRVIEAFSGAFIAQIILIIAIKIRHRFMKGGKNSKGARTPRAARKTQLLA